MWGAASSFGRRLAVWGERKSGQGGWMDGSELQQPKEL